MHRRDHGRPPAGRRQARRDDTAPRQDAAGAVLALQRSAGNQAVGALLARAPAEDRGRPEGPGGPAQVTLGDVGPIQVLSVQVPASIGGAGPGSGRGRGREETLSGHLIVTAKVGPHSTAISRAYTDARAMDGRVDFAGEFHLELTKAVVSGYQVSTADDGATETWTLDAEGVKAVTLQPETGEP